MFECYDRAERRSEVGFDADRKASWRLPVTVPLYASKDASTGQFRGVAPSLGADLAKRLGVPYEPVPYASVPALMAGAKAGEWDITTMGINPERAALMDFSVAFMEVEQGFLVRAGVALNSADEVDRAGIRIGVLEKAAGDSFSARD